MSATDWIKMRTNLWDDPRVTAMADLCGVGEAHIVGGLYWLWSTADAHSVDGVLPGMSRRAIDRKVQIDGFAEALWCSGWLEEVPRGVAVPRFEERNPSSAKKRAEMAKARGLGRAPRQSVMPFLCHREYLGMVDNRASGTGRLQ